MSTRPAYGPGEVERLTAHRRPHLFQFTRADRARTASLPRPPAARRHAHQSRLLQRHPRRRAAMTPARPARASAPRARRSIFCRGARSTSSTCTRCADPARRLGRPDRACRARVRALPSPGESGEFRRRPFHQQSRATILDKLAAAIKAFPRRVRRRDHPGARARAYRGYAAICVGHRHRPAQERAADRHPRCLGLDAHARRARGALHAAHSSVPASPACTPTPTCSAARHA